MDHRRHLELAELLVEQVPPAVGERRIGPVAARGIGIEIHADEAELREALQLWNAVLRRHARVLRLPDRREVVGQQCADAMDEVVRHAGPHDAGLLGPDQCAMPAARGEKMVRSEPRSFCSVICGSTLRIRS